MLRFVLILFTSFFDEFQHFFKAFSVRFSLLLSEFDWNAFLLDQKLSTAVCSFFITYHYIAPAAKQFFFVRNKPFGRTIRNRRLPPCRAGFVKEKRGQ